MAALFVFLLLPYDYLTERTDEIDRRRKETASGQAPAGGSSSQRSCKGAKGTDTAVDPGGGGFGEGLSHRERDGSERARRCFTRAFSITGVGRSGKPGRSAFFFIPKGALTHHPRCGWWYGLRPTRALRGGCGSCGSLQPMLPRLRSRSSLSARRDRCAAPFACENLPLYAPRVRQLYRRGRDGQVCPSLYSLLRKRNRKIGGENDWQSTIWRRRSLAEARVAPSARPRLI